MQGRSRWAAWSRADGAAGPPGVALTEPRAIADEVARELAAAGAAAVALVGSHAAGTATPESDVDLAAIGEGLRYRLESRRGTLVSVGWASFDEQRRRLYDPAWLTTHVPGWRAAVPLHDPRGLAARLVDEARAWSWELVADDLDRWAADDVAGHAEEVHKLVASMRSGNAALAAVQRSVLALRLARPLALRHRILYASENTLWSAVGHVLGEEWRAAQSAALGAGGESLEESCRAALRLFALAAGDLEPVLDERERAVVAEALRRADGAE